jgi:hypothetical protein
MFMYKHINLDLVVVVVIDAFVGRTYHCRPKPSQQRTQEVRTPAQDK